MYKNFESLVKIIKKNRVGLIRGGQMKAVLALGKRKRIMKAHRPTVPFDSPVLQ